MQTYRRGESCKLISRSLSLPSASWGGVADIVFDAGFETVGGMLIANAIGSWADKKDIQRNKNLIQKVLEENADNETGSISYSKTWTNPNGQTQSGTVQQSATPRSTYQQHLGSDGRPLIEGGYNDVWHTGSQRSNNSGVAVGGSPHSNRYASGSSPSYCRDMEISISIEGLTNTPQKTQWYKYCRDPQTGWKQVQ